MSSDIGVQIPEVHPVDWAWYREFGGMAAVPPAVRLRNRRITRRALAKAGALAAAVGGIALGSGLLWARGDISWRPVLLIALCGAAGMALYTRDVTRRAVTARRRNVAAAVRAARADRIFGIPYVAAAQGSRQGFPIPALRAARTTAALLDLLLAVPGPSVFHRIGTPGGSTADHAVACGNAVFLVDSANFGGGMWEWAAGTRDIAIPTFRGSKPRPQSLHEAADELRCLLGPEIEVIPIVLVHGARVARGSTSLSPNGVHLLTASAALERIGNTCAYGFAGTARMPGLQEALQELLV
ncbi:hypothetical protein J2W20_000608 [Sinomonas atrocyanea]|uniref:hypothetical protein n=1 Tax=Sinomonas atrocyanea TaxID=37927 RepID=UPI00278974EB|nr:hypothetical protein [Sinomonas atrocyanea]MDQ0258733.1 hypothetical protein [Sinomonas atrocyanea]